MFSPFPIDFIWFIHLYVYSSVDFPYVAYIWMGDFKDESLNCAYAISPSRCIDIDLLAAFGSLKSLFVC